MESSINIFAENLRNMREKRGLSQKQLGARMLVSHSTIARWESGSRLPDAAMILRLSRFLGVDANTLFQFVAQSEENPNVIMVDDSSIVLSDGLAVMEEVMPNAAITGFIWPQEAIEFARANRVELAVLDIEMGRSSGLDPFHGQRSRVGYSPWGHKELDMTERLSTAQVLF